MDFDKRLKDDVSLIEDKINEYCPKEEGPAKILYEAVNYSIKAGGKRLRPMIMLETARMFNADEKEVYPFMIALEYIHNYSLVHDDLPAMDNDLLRRGKKTTHAVYGEDMGILAGDAMLNYAYEIMSDAVRESSNPKNAAAAMSVIALKAGMYGMVGGQAVDVMNEGKEIDENTLKFIHRLKTAALIEASMMAGAYLAGADDETADKLSAIATDIGMAFQIQDDILDVEGDQEVIGKPVNSDEKNNKITYVTLYGIDKSKKLVKEYTERALELFDALGGENEFLRELMIKLVNREK